MPNDQSVIDHLISLEDLASQFKVSKDAYRKRYLANPDSKHPKPVMRRPTLFNREDVQQFFGKK